MNPFWCLTLVTGSCNVNLESENRSLSNRGLSLFFTLALAFETQPWSCYKEKVKCHCWDHLSDGKKSKWESEQGAKKFEGTLDSEKSHMWHTDNIWMQLQPEAKMIQRENHIWGLGIYDNSGALSTLLQLSSMSISPCQDNMNRISAVWQSEQGFSLLVPQSSQGCHCTHH